MKNLALNLMLLIATCLFSSCATLFTKSSKDVSFKGLPGTVLTDESQATPLGVIQDNGFTTVSMKKQLAKKVVKASKGGYEPQNFIVPTKVEGAFWGNILLGGIPGMAVDAATGKMKTYKKDIVDVTLRNKTNVSVVEEESVRTVMKREANEAQDDLESIIIRWNIDSDPRGARVSYRVISSVPNEVKNTNEAYISPTPLEESRSFNIKGLTRKNANSVTIEIKVEKRGFETQVKRYNLGQAIEQQEISGFFELVAKQN